jgi:hypothetical protein
MIDNTRNKNNAQNNYHNLFIFHANNKENLLELPRVAIRNRAIFPIFFIKLFM